MLMHCSPQQILDALAAVADALIGYEEHLRALDAELGDGDLGITVRAGFTAVKAILAGRTPDDEAGAVLVRCGLAFSEANPSTMATLFGTALIRAGRELTGKTLLTAADLAVMGHAAAEGIAQRGKARLGDKTILDALIPAVTALQQGAADGLDIPTACDAAAAAAAEGARTAAMLQSRVSRASWQGERSIGKPDPGAQFCVLLCAAWARQMHALAAELPHA